MAYLVVPHQAQQRAATAWIGALDKSAEPRRIGLTLDGQPVPLPNAWERWPTSGSPWITFQRVPLTGLTPGRRYRLDLQVAGVHAAEASFQTLPERLPGLDAAPFTVLLGSCFWAGSDEEGQLAHAYQALPHAARPAVKIFTGDQVYLDAPWSYWLGAVPTPTTLAAKLYDTYARVWAGRDNAPGLRPLLTDSANIFTADDHELWNNAPNRAYYVPYTWFQLGRDRWQEIASSLYRAFQRDRPISRFAVGKLSFLVADTRMRRTPDRRQFMDPPDLDEVLEWIVDLQGPGVLAIGSPLFVKPSNWFWGRAVDWTLANFEEQYRRLAAALIGARHSVVVLTGDVHFGRIASCQLPSGAELIEVTASPLSLVDPQARGRPPRKEDLQRQCFPAEPKGGVQREVTVDERYLRTDNHFLTLEFTAHGPTVRMRVRSWAAGAAGELVPPPVGDRYLH